MSTTAQPKTALVLAGGKGERLWPLTQDRPKPMVEVNGRPIVEHHLAWLRANGVERTFLLTGYMHEVIAEHFSAPRIEGLEVRCIAEASPLGRGGAFKNAYREAGLADNAVIATNGDVLTEQPLAPLVEAHERAGALATVMLTPMISPFGIVDTDGGLVTGFREKPPLPYWINAGVYVLTREAIARFPDLGDHETETFPALASEGRLAAFESGAYWKSVESQKDLREAGERLARAS
ncbi:MAG: nucleotidyltransferase family protein [Chloroflexi bacterium]|nr:nucleotidyltransferase family protein [Chloroflexota bacterium]